MDAFRFTFTTCGEAREVRVTVYADTEDAALSKVEAIFSNSHVFQLIEAVEIQRDIGGDLAELLDNVTSTIRDRRRVSRQISTLTAEGRLSAVILFCLPISMFCFMAFFNGAYLHDLTGSFAGNVMLAAAGALMVTGGLWLRRIVRVLY